MFRKKIIGNQGRHHVGSSRVRRHYDSAFRSSASKGERKRSSVLERSLSVERALCSRLILLMSPIKAGSSSRDSPLAGGS